MASAKYAGRLCSPDGNYLVAIDPAGTERVLPRHLIEPAWGYGGGGPNSAAWAILDDAYGPIVADQLAGKFVSEKLNGEKTPRGVPFTMDRTVVEQWVQAQGVRVD